MNPEDIDEIKLLYDELKYITDTDIQLELIQKILKTSFVSSAKFNEETLTGTFIAEPDKYNGYIFYVITIKFFNVDKFSIEELKSKFFEVTCISNSDFVKDLEKRSFTTSMEFGRISKKKDSINRTVFVYEITSREYDKTSNVIDVQYSNNE